MKRLLGLGFGLAVIVGGTLGIGILRAPGLVAGAMPSASATIAVWIVGGLYTLVGAICFTELGTMIPAAGGYYIYARRAFGDAVGFAVGWTDWLTYCAVLGYVSIGMADFVGRLVPPLAPHGTTVAVAILAGFVALQWAGLRVSSAFQTTTTVLKAAAFLALVAAAFLWRPSTTAPPAAPIVVTLAGLVAAFQAVVITFGGWQSALYFTEEDRDPTRNLPRAMIGGVAAVIVIYVLVNLALLAVLPQADMARSTLPAATAAQAIAGPTGGTLITLLSLISLPPLLNAMMMIGTRIVFALGRDGLVWPGLAKVDDRGVIGGATLVTTVVAIALIVTGTFERLVAIAAFFLMANYCVCCAALVRLRRTEPAAPRPFRAWGYPWSAGIVLVGAAAFLLGGLAGDPLNGGVAMALLVAGVAVGVGVRRSRKPT